MRSYLDDMEPRIEDGLKLAKSLGASAACITYSHTAGTGIGFEANRLKTCGLSEKQGYAISLIINGKSGLAGGNMPEALPEMIRRAAAFAEFGAEAHFETYPEPAKDYPEIKFHSDSVKAVTTEKLTADCQSMVDRLLKLDSSLMADAEGDVSEGESIFATSGGCMFRNKSTSWSIGAGFQKTVDTDMLFSGAYRHGCQIDENYNLDAICDEVEFDYIHGTRHAKTESGTVQLILPPTVIGRFLSPISMGINGRNVYKGTSPLKDKLGTQCFSPALSILDNPHIDYMGSSEYHDDAGLPTQKRMLVENGVLNCFLYDYDTAGLAGTTPTGNSGCSPYTMFVTPGQTSSADLIKSVKKGIYVKQMLGFGQTNLSNGDFSANLLLGFLIENGEIVGRVKDTMIAGNIFQLLKGDIQFSSDVHPQNKQPYALIPGVALKA